MRRCIELLFIGLFLVNKCFCNSKEIGPKVAIIGAGIGGASTSHFLTELLDGNLEIDIFEPNQIGGRLATVEVAGETYEAGGSIIHPRNKYMKDFVKLLGLEPRPTSKETSAGIWNGDEFIFTESNWAIVNILKLLYRYGLQPLKLHRHVNSIQESFENIYQYQDNGLAYKSVIDLLSALSPELPELLQISTAEYLQSLGYSKNIINELVRATLVVNYGQNTDAHSLVGCVSIAAAGADLWSVKGGNKEVPTHLIYRNSKVNIVPSQVTAIRNLPTEEIVPQYEISYKNAGSNNVMKDIYDIVVIAAPLTTDQKYHIEFLDFPNNDNFRFPGNYHTTVVTFIEGDINPSHFGLEKSIDEILSCNPNKTEINCVAKIYPVDGSGGKDSRVWKIFSEKSLTPDQISSMFSQVHQVKEIQWKASPKYSTNARLDKFELHESLYHVNAMEWAASAMEMSAVAGRNVALLIHNKLMLCCRDSSTTEKKRCKCSCKGQKVPVQGKRNVEL